MRRDYSLRSSTPDMVIEALRVIKESGEEGISQSCLWKELGMSSREGSRIARRLEREGKIRRKRVLENGRWSFKLTANKTVFEMLEIQIPEELAPPHFEGEQSTGGLTRAYYWHKGRKRKISRFLLDRELAELNEIVSKLDLGDRTREVADEAHSIFKKAVVAGLSRGRSIEALTAAAIYAACRKLLVPANLNDICRLSNAKKTLVTRCYRKMLFKRIFEVPIPDYSVSLDRLLNRLETFCYVFLTKDVRKKALYIIEKAQKSGVSRGKQLSSIVAASLYIACEGQVLQREMAQAAGISEVTLRNNYRKLKSLAPKD
jgi:DNA-binding Lrp family transcriptional regulator